MIKTFKSYKQGVAMIKRTNMDLFEKIKGIAPHYHILSDERREEEIDYISDILSYQMTEIYELTAGKNIYLNNSLISSIKAKINKKIFSKLMTVRTELTKKEIIRMKTHLNTKNSINSAVSILLFAEPRSMGSAFEYIDCKSIEYLNNLEKVRR